MDEITRDWYNLKFTVDFLRKRGEAFQSLFSDIMERRYLGDFVRTRPWGNVGDRKNDGYLKSGRMLFQVYAPNEMAVQKTIQKIEADFYGALPYWRDYFDEWVFVHNADDGLAPDIVATLLKLEQNHKPLKITQWGRVELEREARQLTHDDLTSLFGYAPSIWAIHQVGFEDFKVLLDAIIEQEVTSQVDLRPPPADKLARNALSSDVDALLRAGMRRSERVKKFLETCHVPQYGDRIVEAFRQQYQSFRGRGFPPDQIFMELLEFVGGMRRGSVKQEAAALAVLAYLFEQCDIFER
jgi:hypothetical protein